jgi:hypothetical protein
MTPEEKAEEIFNKYANAIYQRALTVMQYEVCKECALIAVDEILDTIKWCIGDSQVEYWQEVKKEIELL